MLILAAPKRTWKSILKSFLVISSYALAFTVLSHILILAIYVMIYAYMGANVAYVGYAITEAVIFSTIIISYVLAWSYITNRSSNRFFRAFQHAGASNREE